MDRTEFLRGLEDLCEQSSKLSHDAYELLQNQKIERGLPLWNSIIPAVNAAESALASLMEELTTGGQARQYVEKAILSWYTFHLEMNDLDPSDAGPCLTTLTYRKGDCQRGYEWSFRLASRISHGEGVFHSDGYSYADCYSFEESFW